MPLPLLLLLQPLVEGLPYSEEEVHGRAVLTLAISEGAGGGDAA